MMIKNCCLAVIAIVSINSLAHAGVIASGSYSAGGEVFDGGSLSLGPGAYNFYLNTSNAPSSINAAYFEEIYSYNDFYDCYGNGIEYCGGNDDPVDANLTQATPRKFETSVYVQPATTTPLGGGGYEISYDTCCTYVIDFNSQGAGSYVLSYTAAPEPTTWSLMILGAAFAGMSLRRRRRATIAV